MILGGACLIAGYMTAWAAAEARARCPPSCGPFIGASRWTGCAGLMRPRQPTVVRVDSARVRVQMRELRRYVPNCATTSRATDANASARRPLRVCHVAYTFYELGQPGHALRAGARGRGDAVDVVALRRRARLGERPTDGVSLLSDPATLAHRENALTYLLKMLWFCFKSSVVVTALQLRHRYDVVHVHNVPDFLVFVAWLPEADGRPGHSRHPRHPARAVRGQVRRRHRRRGSSGRSLAVERACCRFADHVIVANHLWHERLIARSVPALECTAIMNYPDLGLFKGRRAVSVPAESPFLILYPGTLNHHQGVDIAVRAFAIAAPQMPGAEFHVYGRGPTSRC